MYVENRFCEAMCNVHVSSGEHFPQYSVHTLITYCMSSDLRAFIIHQASMKEVFILGCLTIWTFLHRFKRRNQTRAICLVPYGSSAVWFSICRPCVGLLLRNAVCVRASHARLVHPNWLLSLFKSLSFRVHAQ